MAWDHSDWAEKDTDAEQLATLNQHITEVNDKISADVSADGHSRSTGSLMTYLQGLMEERQKLRDVLGVGTAPRRLQVVRRV